MKSSVQGGATPHGEMNQFSFFYQACNSSAQPATVEPFCSGAKPTNPELDSWGNRISATSPRFGIGSNVVPLDWLHGSDVSQANVARLTSTQHKTKTVNERKKNKKTNKTRPGADSARSLDVGQHLDEQRRVFGILERRRRQKRGLVGRDDAAGRHRRRRLAVHQRALVRRRRRDGTRKLHGRFVHRNHRRRRPIGHAFLDWRTDTQTRKTR